ncbi:hypothetical protein ACFVU3_00420 [Streptomyces sp. NPDC058052]|uniref:hypothetical protein n=1 Tax=Streptomyces sp. NPDC058052 TaxID=3346316 RepID=UPI0036E54FD4
MIIVHTPSDGPVEHFDIKTIRAGEATKITGMLAEKASWPQVKQLLSDDHPDAMRVVAFVIKCRNEPGLRIADFDPLVAELGVRFDREETDAWGETAAHFAAVFEGPEEQLRAELSLILDLAADQDYAREVIDRVVAGKFPPVLDESSSGSPGSTTAPLVSSEPSTSDSSPTSSTSMESVSTT